MEQLKSQIPRYGQLFDTCRDPTIGWGVRRVFEKLIKQIIDETQKPDIWPNNPELEPWKCNLQREAQRQMRM